MALRIEWKNLEGETQVFELANSEVTFGRNSDSDIFVPNRYVSRQHAKLVPGADGFTLVDLKSTYGTSVNGERTMQQVLRNGDAITFGKGDIEFRYLTGEKQAPSALDTAEDVQRSIEDLNRVLPSAVSDLERLMCVLDFQREWNQKFTPESTFEQILESALNISGAERAFIMVPKGDGFGFASGRDGKGRKLSEVHFQTSKSVVRKVVASGRPVFMTEGIDSDLASEKSIVAMNLRAVACMPLHVIPNEGDELELLGILYLDSTSPMHLASGIDQRILTKLATEAGHVLERVETNKILEQRKKLERDLALAEETQRSLLPHELPKMEMLRLHAFSRPTRYVGGDFYHFEKVSADRLIGVLADVSGKGIAASLLSAMLVGCLQLLLRSGDSPQKVLSRLNAFLLEKSSNRFVTMFLFSVDQFGKGEYISAGHNPSYLYRVAANAVEELSSTSLMVGAFSFATFESNALELHPGDILLAYSDGLTEAENATGEMFGEDRLKGIIVKEAPHGAEHLLKTVLAALDEFTEKQLQTDDITIMIAERAR